MLVGNAFITFLLVALVTVVLAAFIVVLLVVFIAVMLAAFIAVLLVLFVKFSMFVFIYGSPGVVSNCLLGGTDCVVVFHGRKLGDPRFESTLLDCNCTDCDNVVGIVKGLHPFHYTGGI